MTNNLFTRLAIIILVVCAAAVSVYTNKLKGGIDLAGGTSMLYQLDTSKYQGADTAQLAERVVETLKRRVDPQGLKNLVWRVIGGNRIEIQMPMAGREGIEARERLEKAKEALNESNFKLSEINAFLSRTGTARAKAIDELSEGSPERRKLLEALSAADLQRKAAEKAKDFKVTADARDAYDAALNALLATNVDLARVTTLLGVTDGAKSITARAELEKLIASNPSKAKYFSELMTAWDRSQKLGGGLDDPADLQRLLRGSGVLEFRIAVNFSDEGGSVAISQALEELRSKGPSRASIHRGWRWFQVDPENGNDLAGSCISGEWSGNRYVLLCDDPARSLTHDPSRQDWKLADAQLGSDPSTGSLVVNFRFDDNGGFLFGELTRANIKRPMAILLDDKAISAPTIQTAITGGSGQISFGRVSEDHPAQAVQRDAENLVRMLNAGSLPATLEPDPISVQTIGPQLGADNLKAGLRSGLIAVVAVMAFMVVYYTITGFFADVALLINLLMLLGTMAFCEATFTLPGIAGVVLTLGMAVDANVLINERIREELHRGATLWNAVRQGYDKVFWTIFDANLTTSLTSIVLIMFASEEVKGFGVTLLIGLLIHMFTALFVTRTLMLLAMKFGFFNAIDDLSVAEYFRDIFTGTWIKGRWPFMRVVTVSNIDWIGKRHIFWGVSAVMMILGLTAFFIRGSDKYDTEFNGGTQITFRLKDGRSMDIEDVRKRITGMAKLPGFEDVSQAVIYEIGKQHNQFQVVTTVPEAVGGKRTRKFSEALAEQFPDLLEITPRLSFSESEKSARDIADLMERHVVVPISAEQKTLDRVIPGAPALDIADYAGGVAIKLENIEPAQSVKQLHDRIRQMRQQPDMKDLAFREFRVVALASQDNAVTGNEQRPLKSAVVLAVDPSFNPDQDPARWREKVAAPEWEVTRGALTRQSSLQGVSSFDPQVASGARLQAILAIVLSLLLIVVYVWIRFGGLRYGLGAIFSLAHDAIIAMAATVLAAYFAKTGLGKALLISDFKINLTMIAAYLTIIGYSVNDTIVIFDRIRENRGRDNKPLTAKLVNDSINQCFGRTIWTTFTVFIVVLIMYIWGGEGIRGFSYAMLIGVFTGAYSTLAIASPMLLSVEDKSKNLALIVKPQPEAGPETGP